MIGYYFLAIIFGLMAGSFMNALLWRTRENLSIFVGRSMCPKCRQKILWYDNIPVVSYLILGGRCRNCQEKISWQYPVIELVSALLFLVVAYFDKITIHFISPMMVRDWIIVFTLMFIFVYDLKHQLILDRTTLPSSFVLFLVNWSAHWLTPQSMLIGIAVGAGFFIFQYLISSGRWIGGGDIRLGLFMGIILGWPNTLLALGLAYVLGALFSLILIILKKKNLQSETPFGTYLALATFITMFWGNQIVSWYVSLLR